MRQPSEHGTHLSLRPFPTSFPTRSTSLASLSPKCLTVQGPGPTLSPLSCLMQETESSAWGTTTAPSTPRSTAHTEQGCLQDEMGLARSLAPVRTRLQRDRA